MWKHQSDRTVKGSGGFPHVKTFLSHRRDIVEGDNAPHHQSTTRQRSRDCCPCCQGPSQAPDRNPSHAFTERPETMSEMKRYPGTHLGNILKQRPRWNVILLSSNLSWYSIFHGRLPLNSPRRIPHIATCHSAHKAVLDTCGGHNILRSPCIFLITF